MVKFVPFISILLALTFGQGQAHPKIQRSLTKSLESKGQVNVFVALREGSTEPILRSLESARNFAALTHAQRTTRVTQLLKAHAAVKQKPLLEFLSSNFPNIEVKSFWIVNQVYLKNVNSEVIEALASLHLISDIKEETETHIKHFFSGATEGPALQERSNDVEWGLENMRVPEVWNLTGNTGEGLIVGNIDTGVRGSHVLLSSKWVGLHNNGWYDPEGLNPVPHDVYNHGTHTMGMLVGDNGIGIVPSARWLACKGYRDNGSGSAATFIACCEYMLCPTDYLGNNEDCSKAPHVVSNSWGWSGDTPFFTPAIHAWNAAGIVSSFSAGNNGWDGCSSIYSPADQPEIAAVGATDRLNRWADWSSLGPSPDDLLKPEVSAPGVDIYSASSASDTAMKISSGTSMSCPSTSGVLALLKNQDRNLVQSRAMDILQRTSRRDGPTTGGSCDGISDDVYPNNHIGHGIIDAYAAMLELISKQN